MAEKHFSGLSNADLYLKSGLDWCAAAATSPPAPLPSSPQRTLGPWHGTIWTTAVIIVVSVPVPLAPFTVDCSVDLVDTLRPKPAATSAAGAGLGDPLEVHAPRPTRCTLSRRHWPQPGSRHLTASSSCTSSCTTASRGLRAADAAHNEVRPVVRDEIEHEHRCRAATHSSPFTYRPS